MAYIVNTITNKIGTPNIRARVTEPYTEFSPVNHFPPNSIKINARQIFIVANVTIISGISKNVMISPFTVADDGAAEAIGRAEHPCWL